MIIPQKTRTIDTMSNAKLNTKLQHSYEQSLAGEGMPFNEVFDELERNLVQWTPIKTWKGSGKMLLTVDKIEEQVKKVSKDYPIKKISLFGSYADGTCDENSDVDLLVEFDIPHVSLFLLSGLRLQLQDELGKDVDLIHAPISEDSIIEIREEISLYESQG